ncbi:MAG: NAD-dependent dehydratase [Candidatus Ryanbacteria bacterium CG10_big_fil_rev_8_21_14_0_10_43_42]|uniref:NAD-dependent dehydratase n=1 Tax=Candidatus Ryanbacteria bacterium CG10_big_fil_rev_8_21_14_0_10_43_42 TaxID=1974864 RepID=A0A2M8KXG6_9BACT|nr:MAG: NAD-dependent dehydratase [Candidatus Ryanbacteria bacterium CG10_big_fil_rev_8_21_14_0_10_43_42]
MKQKAKKRVLVVGGAGYIGGAVTDILAQKKIPYTVYDALFYEDRYLKPGGDFVYGDVRDTKKLKNIINDYTDIIWLAAIVGDGACYLQPLAAVDINEKAIQWLARNYKGRILFPSTCSVYGSNEEEVTEESKPNPLSLYATTKVNAEQHLLKHPNAIIFRLGTAFGVSDTYSRPRTDLVVNTLTTNAVANGEITVFGGNQQRPNIHVCNIARTFVHNLFTKNTGIYNVSTVNHNIVEIAEMVKKHTKCHIHSSGKRFEDNRHYFASTAKAKRDNVLSQDTKKDVMYGIKEMAELVRSGRVKDYKHITYSNAKHLGTSSL